MTVLFCPACRLVAPPFMDESFTCASGHAPVNLKRMDGVRGPEPYRDIVVDEFEALEEGG